MAATYLDDAGIAARNMDDWCEWFKLYQRYLSREDTQVFCRQMTKQQIIERLVAHGIDPDDVPKIIGSDEPDVSAGIVVLGVPVGTPAFVRAFLDGQLKKVRDLVERIVELPQLADAHQPAVQVANLLLRWCVPRVR